MHARGYNEGVDILTVRNLDPEVKARLRQQAARHGRSMEAEARAILTAGVVREEEHTDLISSIMRHFADNPVVLELPDRSSAMQRPIEFDA